MKRGPEDEADDEDDEDDVSDSDWIRMVTVGFNAFL